MELITLKINTGNTPLLMEILSSLNFVHEVQIVVSPLENLPNEMLQKERNDWLSLSSRGLANAYGDDEPTYENVLVKEPNPLYQAK